MPGRLLLIGVVFCFSVLMTVSAVAAEEGSASLWSLGIANDSFFDQDRGYTSGWDIAYTPQSSPFTVRIGQDLYTPDRETTKTPPSGQHPYAAWLYARGGLSLPALSGCFDDGQCQFWYDWGPGSGGGISGCGSPGSGF